jgi:hypothetical protein
MWISCIDGKNRRTWIWTCRLLLNTSRYVGLPSTQSCPIGIWQSRFPRLPDVPSSLFHAVNSIAALHGDNPMVSERYLGQSETAIKRRAIDSCSRTLTGEESLHFFLTYLYIVSSSLSRVNWLINAKPIRQSSMRLKKTREVLGSNHFI